jgi:Flp pilus assembly protein TadD
MGRRSRPKQEKGQRDFKEERRRYFRRKRVKQFLTRLFVYLALTVLCAVVISIKVNYTTKKHAGYDPCNGVNHYRSEAAFHYRYAAMIARGEPIPLTDKMIQYPEGLDTRHYVTSVMEHVYGRLHRWFFSRTPLHHFLTYATAIFSTFAVVVCFFAGRTLGASPWVGLFSACLFGLTLGSFGRHYSFVREDFALPLLLGSFVCLVSCIRRERWVVAAVGAVLQVVALASWHLSQFYFQLLILGFALLVLVYPPESLPRRTFTIYIVTTIAAAIVLPVLRAKFFLVSTGLTLSYALLIVLWLVPQRGRWSRKKVTLVTVVLMLLFVGAGQILQVVMKTHSHVYALLWAKIRYLGMLPADPTLLPFEAKIMWSRSFESPTVGRIVMLCTTSLLFGFLGMVVVLSRISRRQATADQVLTFYYAVASFVLFLTFDRMVVPATFFLGVLGGMLWTPDVGWRKFAFLALFFPCIMFELGKHHYLHVPPRTPPKSAIADVTSFLSKQTQLGEAVLSSIEMGGPIAAYAGRPVLIHSKFESKTLRNKVEKIYKAIFEDEKYLYDVCQEYGALYLVYQSDMALGFGPGSVRYEAGHHTLSTRSAAFLLHYAPDKLRYFRLVHQNAYYRIYRVDLAQDVPLHCLPFEPIYDLGLFTAGDPGGNLSDEWIEVGLRKLEALLRIEQRATRLLEAGEVSEALKAFQQALDIYPKHPRLLFSLSVARLNAGEYQEAARALIKAIELDPCLEPDYTGLWPPNVLITFAIANYVQGDFSLAEKLCRRALMQEKHSWLVHHYLGLSLFEQGRVAEAESKFLEAIRMNTKCFSAYTHLGKIYASRGEYDKAADAFAQSLSIAPNQPGLRESIAELRVRGVSAPRN